MKCLKPLVWVLNSETYLGFLSYDMTTSVVNGSRNVKFMENEVFIWVTTFLLVFIIVMEWLCVAIKEVVVHELFRPTRVPNVEVMLSHLFFVDDVIFSRRLCNKLKICQFLIKKLKSNDVYRYRNEELRVRCYLGKVNKS